MKLTPLLVAALLVYSACDELESADDVRAAPTTPPVATMDASLQNDASVSDAQAADAGADAGDSASLDASIGAT